jgi:hypothetical protein
VMGSAKYLKRLGSEYAVIGMGSEQDSDGAAMDRQWHGQVR